MATTYPGVIDTFVNPLGTDALNSATVPHAAQHDNINDAVKAVETALGANLSNVGVLNVANVFTAGQTANSFIPTSATVPANGIYLPSANTVGIATNTTGSRVIINAVGEIGIGNVAISGITLRVQKSITGSTSSIGIVSTGQVQSDVTSDVTYVKSTISTQAAAFTLGTAFGFYVNQATIGAGSAITNTYGFFAESNLIGATNNYGFYGNIPSGTNRWNLYMGGTAANYLAGQTTVGSISLTLGAVNTVAQQFGVVSQASTTVGEVIRGAAAQTANLTEWQNSGGTVLANVTSAGITASQGNDTSGGATVTSPTPTSGVAFTPSTTKNAEVIFQLAGITGSYTVTYGPSTGAENTLASAVPTLLNVGDVVSFMVPKGWKVVITLTTVTLSRTTVTTF